MANLSPDVGELLGKLLPRLASDAPSEVVATVAVIQRTLDRAGLDLHDLVARLLEPPHPVHPQPKADNESPDLLAMARRLRSHAHSRLAPHEVKFVHNVEQMLASKRSLSPKQTNWLRDLYAVHMGN